MDALWPNFYAWTISPRGLGSDTFKGTAQLETRKRPEASRRLRPSRNARPERELAEGFVSVGQITRVGRCFVGCGR